MHMSAPCLDDNQQPRPRCMVGGSQVELPMTHAAKASKTLPSVSMNVHLSAICAYFSTHLHAVMYAISRRGWPLGRACCTVSYPYVHLCESLPACPCMYMRVTLSVYAYGMSAGICVYFYVSSCPHHCPHICFSVGTCLVSCCAPY